MNLQQRIGFAAAAISSTMCLVTPTYAAEIEGSITIKEAPERPYFAYSGRTGPKFWGALNPEWQTCGVGDAQSPVDIATRNTSEDVGAPLVFDYQPTPITILNNGHTVEVAYESGSSLSVEGNTYDLLQFHFHGPSEHTRDGGAHFAAEMHLVHKSADGTLAVVAVFIREGNRNRALGSLRRQRQILPAAEGMEYQLERRINVADLLPDERSYFHYTGSLTTPPCTEDVAWYVLETPVEMSGTQLRALRDVIGGLRFASNAGTNNRPTQPINGRDVTSNNSN